MDKARRRLVITIDERSVDRAKRYSELHGISISRLVDDFLSRLPVMEDEHGGLTPDVQRLHGIGAGTADRAGYRARLREKCRT
jgi:hypothetical protein